jgi:hypothetical protein
MSKQNLSSLAVEAFARMDANKKSDNAKKPSDYQAAQKAEYAKTQRLRELRLAKEAADRAAKELNPVAPKKKAASKKKPTDEPPKARRSISWGL